MSVLGQFSWVWGRGREVAQHWWVWAQRAGEAAGILWLGEGCGLELLGYFRAGGAERAVAWLCGCDSSFWVGTSHLCSAATWGCDRGPRAGVKLCRTLGCLQHASSQGRARPGAIWQSSVTEVLLGYRGPAVPCRAAPANGLFWGSTVCWVGVPSHAAGEGLWGRQERGMGLGNQRGTKPLLSPWFQQGQMG